VFLILFSLWVMLCGRFTADSGMLQICVTGAVVAALVCIFARHAFGYTFREELRMYKKAPWFLAYIGLLLKEILVANLQMMRLVLNRKVELHPVMVQFQVPLRTQFARVLLANSITRTPGTITAEINADSLTVHCVDASFSEGLESSSFVKMLEKMEKNYD